MKVSVIFTKEELMLLSRALTLGIIHTEDDIESNKMQEVERKIQILKALTDNTTEYSLNNHA